MRRVKMLEYALRAERNKYMTTANQQHALVKEKDAQVIVAQKAADDKEKEREGKEGSESSKDGSKKDGTDEKDNKEKPSAIPNDKKKLIKEQTGGAANAASGRASPALTVASEEGTPATTGEMMLPVPPRPYKLTSICVSSSSRRYSLHSESTSFSY